MVSYNDARHLQSRYEAIEFIFFIDIACTYFYLLHLYMLSLITMFSLKISIKTEIEKVEESVENRREVLKEIETELGKKKKECRDFETKLLILTSNTKKKLKSERREMRMIGARGSV